MTTPPTHIAPTVLERVAAAATLVFVIGAAAVVWIFDPTAERFFPVCPLYSYTGLACPGCGLTRGFHALFHGDVVTALDYNALIPLWAVLFGYIFISLLLYAVRGRGLPMSGIKPNILWPIMAVVLIFGVLRNIPVYPLTFLFP